ncbi:cytochrome P450 [Phlebopus sp. FC_14]|nr:cytochrome P450 [Phlebopus sp. FC_14]
MTSSVLGTGVFVSDGEMWKFHRSMTRPFFVQSRISHFNIFDCHAEHAINLMKRRFRAKRAIDFQDLMFRFTLDSATEFLFGRCVHSLSADLPLPYTGTPAGLSKACAPLDFARAFARAQFVISRRPSKGWAWPLFELFKDETEEPMKSVDAFIEPVLRNAMKKHGLAAKRGQLASNKISDEDTLLDHLVRQTTELELLKDEILNIMVAARDTTSAALTFAVYLLSTHPIVFTRLREEIMQIVGPTDRPSIEDIRELKYLRAVIDETLRLYSPVPFNKLESIKATTFPSSNPSEKPYYVPGDTSVWYSLLMMHRRKDLWGPDAEEFDPDRFLDERLHKYLTPRPCIFMPFSAGPRICLGQQFAYNEVSFMLIRLLQNFTSISLAPEAHAPETLPPAAWAKAEGRKAKEKVMPVAHLNMHIRGGLWVRMTEVDNENL